MEIPPDAVCNRIIDQAANQTLIINPEVSYFLNL